MTISQHNSTYFLQNSDGAISIAHHIIVWLLEEEKRKQKFINITGLDGDVLRDNLEDPDILSSIIDYLTHHETDLLACAENINLTPEQLLAAGHILSQSSTYK